MVTFVVDHNVGKALVPILELKGSVFYLNGLRKTKEWDDDHILVHLEEDRTGRVLVTKDVELHSRATDAGVKSILLKGSCGLNYSVRELCTELCKC